MCIYAYLYNDESATSAVIGCCPWSIRVEIHGWRQGKLVFFVLFNMAHGFENVCEILFLIKARECLEKKHSRSYLQRRKMENQRQKELFTTWECLNYKKSSQQLPSCVIAMKDSLFCKCFRHYSAVSKDVEKLFEETVYK